MINFYKTHSKKIEILLIVLALIAITLYLLNLIRIFSKLGLTSEYQILSLALDSIFLIDFIFKLFIYRSKYFKGPWWFIDFIAALPIIASFGYFITFENLVITRSLRFFYILRVIRVVRLTKLFRFMQYDQSQNEYEESNKFRNIIWICTLLLCIFFLISTHIIYSSYTEEAASSIEFFLILGFVASLLICFLIVRVQIPEVTRSEISKLLNIALPKQVAESFLDNPQSMYETTEMPATIVFCDLTGFTSTVEKLEGNHSKLKSHLEHSLGIICEEHIKQDLIIDKFIGDCVMSFKGGKLINGNQRKNAISVVMACLNAKNILNKHNLPFFNDIKIGGASSDKALIGSFGTKNRLTYTVLGDAVNLASRLEGASGHLGVNNLFCKKTKQLTEDNDYFAWRETGEILVSGKKNSVIAYEAIAKNKSNQQWIKHFQNGLENYRIKNFKTAESSFKKVIDSREFPDTLSKIYIQKCNYFIKNGCKNSWTPSIKIDK